MRQRTILLVKDFCRTEALFGLKSRRPLTRNFLGPIVVRSISTGSKCHDNGSRNVTVEFPAEAEQDEAKEGLKDLRIDFSNGPLAAYKSMIALNILRKDEHQVLLVEKLEELFRRIQNYEPYKPGAIGKLFGYKKTKAPKGLYMFGSVGTGKTMLMDLFYKTSTMQRKKRVHFNSFMLDVHKRVHTFKLNSAPVDYRDKTSKAFDPIRPVAEEIADETWLLCFDEFQVTDIADAMVLKKLFSHLFENGIIVVATSNRSPDDLYKNGLQRVNFLPFIPLLKSKCEVFSLDSNIDYRRLDLASIGQIYINTADPSACEKVDEIFRQLCVEQRQQGEFPIETMYLPVFGRKLKIPIACGRVARFSFDELCNQPLGPADYLAISKQFDTVIITDIPQLNLRRKMETKRFITAVDNFYDNHVRLVCSAEERPEKLFLTTPLSAKEKEDNRLLMDDLGIDASGESSQSSLFTAEEEIFAFDRTISRLTEMQTEQYWNFKNEHDS